MDEENVYKSSLHMPLHTGWGTEISQSARAKCRMCKQLIPEGVMRAFAYGEACGHISYVYFHKECGASWLQNQLNDLKKNNLECEFKPAKLKLKEGQMTTVKIRIIYPRNRPRPSVRLWLDAFGRYMEFVTRDLELIKLMSSYWEVMEGRTFRLGFTKQPNGKKKWRFDLATQERENEKVIE